MAMLWIPRGAGNSPIGLCPLSANGLKLPFDMAESGFETRRGLESRRWQHGVADPQSRET
jgi:hypothetical protein